jgi:hypothetical protein
MLCKILMTVTINQVIIMRYNCHFLRQKIFPLCHRLSYLLRQDYALGPFQFSKEFTLSHLCEKTLGCSCATSSCLDPVYPFPGFLVVPFTTKDCKAGSAGKWVLQYAWINPRAYLQLRWFIRSLDLYGEFINFANSPYVSTFFSRAHSAKIHHAIDACSLTCSSVIFSVSTGLRRIKGHLPY